MRRKLFAILSAVILLSVSVSPAFAQSIRLSGSRFDAGSLAAEGNIQFHRLPVQDVALTLEAEGLCDGHPFTAVSAPQHIAVSEFSGGGGAKYHLIADEACDGHVEWTAATIIVSDGSGHVLARFDFTCQTLPQLKCR